jgi:hypothetical protein
MRSLLAVGFVCVVAAITTVAEIDAQGGAQAPLQNLQVLPKTMTRPEVQALMRNVAASLGVQCSHCHVGSPADRAKDDKPEKLMARSMFRMSMAINSDLMKDIGTAPVDGSLRVTCYTCHRGALKVPNAPPPAGGGF